MSASTNVAFSQELSQYDPVLRDVVKADWDWTFIQQPAFRNWLIAELQRAPKDEETPLVTYVQTRLQAAGHATKAASTESRSSTPDDDPIEEDVKPNVKAETSPPSFTPAATIIKVDPGSVNPQSITKQEPTNGTINPAMMARQKALAIPSKATPEPSEYLRVRPTIKASPSPSPQPASTSAPKASTSKLSPWERALPQIKSQLDPDLMQRAPTRTASKLIELLEPFAGSISSDNFCPIETRLEVLTTLTSRGGQKYLQAWCDSAKGLDLLEGWLKEAIKSASESLGAKARLKARNSDRPNVTLIPLLKVWDALPITLLHLRERREVAKLVARVSRTEGLESAATDRSKAVEAKWRRLVQEANRTNGAEQTAAQEAKSQEFKRKADAISAEQEARKKPKIVPKAAPPKVEVKADMSFLKGKAGSALRGLSIGKKAAPAVEPGDAFAEAIKMMTKSVAVGLSAAPTASTSTSVMSKAVGNRKKVRKSVTWKADADLCQIKEIERAVYEDDAGGETSDETDRLRIMDQNEGALLHRSRGDLDILPWSEPQSLEITFNEDEIRDRTYPALNPFLPQLGRPAAEVEAENNADAMEVSYGTEWDRPESPAEAPVESQDLSACIVMDIGHRLNDDAEFKIELDRARRSQAPPPLADANQLNQLLNQLSGTISSIQPMPMLPMHMGYSGPPPIGSFGGMMQSGWPQPANNNWSMSGFR